MGYVVIMISIVMLIISFVIFFYLFRNKDELPTNWPIVGMLPSFLKNIPRFNDFCIELLQKSNLTFHMKGPFLANMHLMLTVDPANIHYVLSKRCKNFEKGSELNQVLEPLGDGILNTDSPLWDYHRKVAQFFFNRPQFKPLLVSITRQKIETGLIPVLDHVSTHGVEVGLQDLFLRFVYDTMCILMMDHDPISLSIDLHDFPLMRATNHLEHLFASRVILPKFVWKLKKWLNVGEEKQVKQSTKVIDDFIYKCIDLKRDEKSSKGDGYYSTTQHNNNNNNVDDLLTLFMNEDEKNTMKAPIISSNDKFLRDTISNFFLAGGETTSTALSWFFYLLSKNPNVVHKIKEELNDALVMPTTDYDDDNNKYHTNLEDFANNSDNNNNNNKLVYLHAALCESLRLYPSLAYNYKTPIESDILPSGHQVNPNTPIILCIHAMGRMKSIWGEDCNEFKPERWISEDGVIKHEPSYKFSVFGSGPRTCIGKQMVFIQMKIVAAFIIQNYRIEVVGKTHVPDFSMLLRMKDEFKVRVFRS